MAKQWTMTKPGRYYSRWWLIILLLILSAKTIYAQTPLIAGWEFSRTDENKWYTATVPGTIHTDLLHHKLIPDPFVGTNEKAVQWVDKHNWQYRTTINATADLLAHDVVELDFKGLDTYADVYVNEQRVLQADNMFAARTVDVKNVLRAGNNILRIVFHSPVKNDMPQFLRDSILYPAGNDASDIALSVYARKAPYHYGWDWGPRLVTSGIWRPVYLHAWNRAVIRDTWVQQLQLDDRQSMLKAAVTVDAIKAGTYTFRVESPEKQFSPVTVTTTLQPGRHTLELPFRINRPQRWWPNGMGAQHLYTVTVTLTADKNVLARQQQRVGLRTIEVVNRPDSLGESFYVKVNGRPVFMKGANYIPQDNFLPRVNKDRYKKIFRDMTDAHFNMVRVWGGGIYEDDLFYDLADEKGILVWQDFMFACTLYPSDSAFFEKVKAETEHNIRRLRRHASLALWCGNNETAVAIDNWGWKSGYAYTDFQWDQLKKGYDRLFKELLPQQVQLLDSGRFYFHSSPISNWGRKEDFTKGDNHYWGVWHGMEWFEAYNTHIPRFMSEFGFQSFPPLETVETFARPEDYHIYSNVMLSHQKSPAKGNTAINTYMLHYYREPKDFPAFLYLSQVLQAEGMKTGIEAHRRAMPYCMGSLYWQLNDCWPGPSWSGIDYYGRWKALHYYVEHAFAPLLLSAVIKDGQLETWVVSDAVTDQQADLQLTAMDLNGKVLWEQTRRNVQIRANTSDKLFATPTAALFAGTDSSRVIWYAKLVNKNKLLADNIFYFVPPKAMPLEKPQLVIRTAAQGNGEVAVTITTNRLARNVYLQLDKSAATEHFSENFFDMLPGTEKTILLKTSRSAAAVQTALKVTTLVDSYN